MFYQNIEGHFNFEKVYDKALSIAKDGDIFVEVGSFLGKSTCYMAERIKQLNLKIKFHTIDTFVGIPSAKRMFKRIKQLGDIYNLFMENMKKANVLDKIIVHKMKSIEASKLFADNSLTFVFIDADHSYEAVKEDIKAWYPKVKINGWLCGHDYGNRIPTGVDKAVPERFGSNFDTIENSWLYYKKL